MSWMLWVQVVMTMTCVPDFPYCPAPQQPVTVQRTFGSEEACLKGAAHYRRFFPERQVMVQNKYLTMERVATVQCKPVSKG
jgi:hypothetical protein